MDKITFREIDRKLPTGKSKRKKIPITYKVELFFSYLYIFANKVKKKCHCYAIHQGFGWVKFILPHRN